MMIIHHENNVLMGRYSKSSITIKDPCIESNLRTVSDPGDRSMHCEYKQGDGNCDSSLTSGWYKTDSPILTQCPGLLSCGAIYPVWMNGNVEYNLYACIYHISEAFYYFKIFNFSIIWKKNLFLKKKSR